MIKKVFSCIICISLILSMCVLVSGCKNKKEETESKGYPLTENNKGVEEIVDNDDGTGSNETPTVDFDTGSIVSGSKASKPSSTTSSDSSSKTSSENTPSVVVSGDSSQNSSNSSKDSSAADSNRETMDGFNPWQ